MKKIWICGCMWISAILVQAQNLPVSEFNYQGPFELQTPYMIDTANVAGKKFDSKTLLDGVPLPVNGQGGKKWTDEVFPVSAAKAGHVLSFSVCTENYTRGKLDFKRPANSKLYLDGDALDGNDFTLEPGTHCFAIKYISVPGETDSLKVVLENPENSGVVLMGTDGKRVLDSSCLTDGMKYYSSEVSPDGKYLITCAYYVQPGGKVQYFTRLTEVASGNTCAEVDNHAHWMPRSNRYYFTRMRTGVRELVCRSPKTGEEEVLATNLPDGDIRISPTEDFLILGQTEKGPQERADVAEIREPDDRQPGWRDRRYFSRYDLKTGLLQRLVYGWHNASVNDISSDGKWLVFSTHTTRITRRPFDLMSVYRLNLATLQVDTLLQDEGFIERVILSPDNKQLLICGSPEAFEGIGKRVKDGQTPNMIETELYLFDISTRKFTPVTADFNPNVQRVQWSRHDNRIYFNAEDKDYVSLFCYDPAKNAIRKLDGKEESVRNFSVASATGAMVYFGESVSNPQRLYLMNTSNGKSTLLEYPQEEMMKRVELGECRDWDFVNSRGDTICGRYYLPPHFDSSRKYPLLVYYYGGCSPTSRDFSSSYPQHVYAAQGYVVYVVQPSGATGFGQEFAARHVNTFGDYVADDIIEGTKKFCAEHAAFINDKKVGCFGASYGGFMTQYLQTRTDIFAAAVSHAGISSMTSYWGEGYWGYSYSSVSAANSYPWSDRDFFTQHSPLYLADKIHTPLLLIHGTADTNVPVGESIQLFTALKLLGRETALVTVDGEDHHIMDYNKRIWWQNSIFAWFAKWLKDDATWWDALYPPKNL